MKITRRDFLNGATFAVGTALFPDVVTATADSAATASLVATDYPPLKTGLRGSHPGAFEVAHAMRDGRKPGADAVRSTGEYYDLVIVGAGISGLSAAYLYRKQKGPGARILVLDNHDDFGGHAKRNEFKIGGKTLLGYGGTQNIEVLSLYTPEAMGMLRELGIEIERFEKYYDQGFRKRHGMADACFFDKSVFGKDTLARNQVGVDFNDHKFDAKKLEAFLSEAPFSEQGKSDMRRLFLEKRDYLPGLSVEEKRKLLRSISIQTFLEKYAKVAPEILQYYQQRTHGSFGSGTDAVNAEGGIFVLPSAVAVGLGLGDGSSMFDSEPYINHFPDGNASIARLLVRSLVPGSAPGSTMEDIVTARMDYSRLDRRQSNVRIRLNSTVVAAKHVGDVENSSAVDVTYVKEGKACSVRADKVILACWNMVIPYICPEMSKAQRDGLSYCVKVPLVYGTVVIRNWHALKKLGVSTAYCAGSYFSEVYMDFPVSIGSYEFTQSPDEPCVLHLVRVPTFPGLPIKDQYRSGRAEILTTSFETFEQRVRDQLGRMFGAGGFDSMRDILAITINRWPHGYAYSYSSLFDPEFAPGQEPHIIGRQRFGRISIANADSGAMAETSVAIEQAMRAVQEVS